MSPPPDLVASTRARLSQLAKQENSTTEELLVRYARERLLFRLASSDHRDRFVLKGAALFYLWTHEPHRPTRDLDFLGSGSLELAEVETIFRELFERGVVQGP